MKRILAVAVLTLFPALAWGQYWHPQSGYMPTLPEVGYGLNPLTEAAFLGAAGGYRAQAPGVPEGEYLVSVEWSVVNGVAVPSNVVTAPIPPTPTLPPDPDVTLPVINTNGTVVGTARVLVDEDLNIVAVVDSQSPQKAIEEQLEQFHERRALLQAERQAAAAADARLANEVTLGTLRDNLGDVRLSLTGISARVNSNVAELQATAALTNGFTAADNRALVNALRREAIDMAIENGKQTRELRAVRKALAQLMKLQDGE